MLILCQCISKVFSRNDSTKRSAAGEGNSLCYYKNSC